MKKSPLDFFLEHAGFSYDPKTETESVGKLRGAIALVDAERLASEAGYFFHWENDPGIDSSDFSDEQPAWRLWICQCCNPQGEIVESLGGIDFGRDGEPWGNPYRRVVEAELALQLGIEEGAE